MKKITAGTRASKLAGIQTELVIQKLKETCRDIKIDTKIIKTKGDKILDIPLAKIKGKGLFTKELEKALYENEIDFAVHSLKDLPVDLPDGLIIGAYLREEKNHDVLISKNNIKFQQIKQNGTIATGSLRRALQIKRIRPDINIVDIRGNIETRIKKFEESDWDGLITAYAALNRLKLNHYISDIFTYDVMLPAVGQGIIAVEIRNDNVLKSLFSKINDNTTMYKAMAQRSYLRGLGGGCQIPAGCLTEISGSLMEITGIYLPDRGKQFIQQTISGPVEEAGILGSKLANIILGEAD